MRKRTGKIPISTLSAVTVFTVILMAIVLSVKIRAQAPFYDEKLAASRRTGQAFEVIRIAVDSMRIPIDPVNDPNRTGLVGLQFSPITIERGDLQSKLTATNPNIAAMIVHLLRHARVHRNDTVAVYMTGSTPALNIATIVALETIGATPVVVTSVGSAMWGANYPELTMLDMERILADAGISDSRTVAATMGGHDETGRGFSPEGRALIIASTARNRIPLLEVQDGSDAMHRILSAFGDSAAIDAFITVSEQPTSLIGYDMPPGILPAHSIKEGSGLITYFSRKGTSVVNLTQVHQLTQRYGLPVAPIPLPEIGTGQLYYEYRNSVFLAVVCLCLLIIILYIALRYDIMPKKE